MNTYTMLTQLDEWFQHRTGGKKRENQKVQMKPPIIKFAYNVGKVFENEMNVKNVPLVGKALSAMHCKYLQRSPLMQFFATLDDIQRLDFSTLDFSTDP